MFALSRGIESFASGGDDVARNERTRGIYLGEERRGDDFRRDGRRTGARDGVRRAEAVRLGSRHERRLQRWRRGQRMRGEIGVALRDSTHARVARPRGRRLVEDFTRRTSGLDFCISAGVQ